MLTKNARRFAVLALLALGAFVALTRPDRAVAQQPQAHVPPPGQPKPSPSLSLLLDFGHEEVRGFWYVVGTACVLFFLSAIVPVLQKLFRSRIFVYRPYELNLLNQGRLKLKDILDYHAQYHWGDYAAITVGMVLLSVTMLVLERIKLEPVQTVITHFAVGFMTLSAIALCFADLVHTNTQTPIIPVRPRFRLINFSVQAGVMGTMLMLLAIILLITLISEWLTVISCVAFCAFLAYTQFRRSVKKREYFEYFGVHSSFGWNQADHQYIDRTNQTTRIEDVKTVTFDETTAEDLQLYAQFSASTIGHPNRDELLQEVCRLLELSKEEIEWFEAQRLEREGQLNRILDVAGDAGKNEAFVQLLEKLKSRACS